MNKILFFILLLMPFWATAQEGGKGDIKAESLEYGIRRGQKVRILKNNVVFTRPEGTLTCDSAYQFTEKPEIEAMSNVRIITQKGSTITGDTLNYFTDTKHAIVRGRVVMVDSNTTLVTKRIDYFMATNMGSYRKGGVINRGPDVLVSDSGTFDNNKNTFYFNRNVTLTSGNNKLLTDTLTFNRKSGIAYFYGPSKVISPDGTLFSTKGKYNTNTEESEFYERTFIQNDDFRLTGDQVFMDRKKKTANAKGNVIMFSEKDSVTILGEIGEYSGKNKQAKVFGNTIMFKPFNNDTLFVLADTLLATPDPSDTSKRVVSGYGNTKVIRNNLQSVCDSLAYKTIDSTIRLYGNPVVWNNKNQMSADTINLFIENKTLKTAQMRINAFTISVDTIGNFNQVKGRYLTTTFDSGQAKNIYVEGNGQTIYFPLKGDTALMGMNKSRCSNIDIKLIKGQIKTISFLSKPESVFVPPHLIEQPETKLKGFNWQPENRPSKTDVFERKSKKNINF